MKIDDLVQWPSRKYGLVRGKLAHILKNEGLLIRGEGDNEEHFIVPLRELQPDSLAKLERICKQNMRGPQQRGFA